MSDLSEIQRLGFDDRAFDRVDEADDADFYSVDRLVPHLDAEAGRVVSAVIEGLVVEERPTILDLMASWDSHLPESLRPSGLVGLGLNRNELDANSALDDRVVHDLNRDPRLPFPDAFFDVVLNTVSIDYLTRPFEVVAEVSRVLKPGGLFLVVFSNRFFPEKVVRVWRQASEQDRAVLVERYLASCGALGASESIVVHGRPRPNGDRYARLGLPSDPIYAVWAEKAGGVAGRRQRRKPDLEPWFITDPGALDRRKSTVTETGSCPYCGSRLRKWMVPQTPFTEWDEEFMLICFNDECPYLLRGWRVMESQGNRGFSYRMMFSPGRNRCMPIPIQSLSALREGIVGE